MKGIEPMPSLAADHLSQALSQQIQQLYKTHLGHHPSKITCQSFEGKLAILLEDALTQPEQLLVNQGQTELVRQIRDCLHEILRPRIKALIQETMGVAVVDLLTATQLETGRVSLMVVLSSLDSDEAANLLTEAEQQVEQGKAVP
jgi:uncharacterized protein YbcI